MRVARDVEADSVVASGLLRIPVVNPTQHHPQLGDVILDITVNPVIPKYADGLQWLPFGGSSGVLESAVLSFPAGTIVATMPTDGNFHLIPFSSDASAPRPHPSITVDIANSQFVINTDGVYNISYLSSPSNQNLCSNGNQPEIFQGQIVASNSPVNPVGFCQTNGSFALINGTLSFPVFAGQFAFAKVTVQGSWTGFLPSTTTVRAFLAIFSQNSGGTEVLSGEGGGNMNTMTIIRIE